MCGRVLVQVLQQRVFQRVKGKGLQKKGTTEMYEKV
jgi:hypothetical protein